MTTQTQHHAGVSGERQGKHVLPPLPYSHDALEPYIDERTMMLHHQKHHAAYVSKLNDALEKAPELKKYSPLWLLLNLDKVPERIRLAVRQNAGGHVNHSLFWRAMKPAAGSEPTAPLRAALDRDFGSFENFKSKFEAAGAALFGSGWVWLVRTSPGGSRLQIITTAGHDHPLMQGFSPLLLNDVWEHAYYLGYENRRPDYLKAWWSIVDWEEAGRRFELSDHSAEKVWEEEGGNSAAAASK